MSTPAPPPRHLPRPAAETPTAPFGGRQAARIRAAVNADLLPEERASADALVMTAWLSAAQRAEYARSLRSGQHTEAFIQHLADERRVVLEEGADPVADELESAAQAERAARQLPLRAAEALLLLVVLGCAVTILSMSIRADSLSWSGVGEPALPLLVTLGVAAVLAAVVGVIASRRRDRSLLGWAASRPGQLGRGLPLRRPLQGGSAGPALMYALGPALLVGAGVLAIVAGAAILLITLMVGDEQGLGAYAPWLLGGGVVSLLGAVIAIYLRHRRLLKMARRSRAAEWLGHEQSFEG